MNTNKTQFWLVVCKRTNTRGKEDEVLWESWVDVINKTNIVSSLSGLVETTE